MPDERHLQYEGLVHQDLEPPVVSVSRRAQAELGVSASTLVDQSLYTELLGESQQFAARCRPLHQIHEVRFRSTFGEEAKRFPGVRILLDAEDLNVHARELR
ncbi:MAG TPA: hypothetical protein VGP25_21390 [Gemmatimonadaceae bacterium]|nr:hypothetical protein [Gemmatimonadaceae bacterium]